MPKIQYTRYKPTWRTQQIIQRANKILEEYAAQGFVLTLRQLYYQFVARDLLPNTEQSYKQLGTIINNARLGGMIDWDYLTDRTRDLRTLSTWESPAEIVSVCIGQYRTDKWANQERRIEVWVEKDALIDVVARACDPYQVPYFSCRGYVSQSEMWAAGRRILTRENGQRTLMLHLGDHDPSGMDMTRDIRDRINLFTEGNGACELIRIALNPSQVEQYAPPPNPAKVTDSRFISYVLHHGEESWELDALEPQVIVDLIQEHIAGAIDPDRWKEAEEVEAEHKGRLERALEVVH